jgi:hypothetical protein
VASAHAEGWEAEVELEISHFPQESPNPQSNYSGNGSVATTLSRSDYWGDAIIDTKLFYREDGHDGNRSHFDVRDLMLTLPIGDYELKAGVGGTFWGFTESVHLLDIINQTDFVESLAGEEKLGQPLLSANWYGPWGTVETYVMPLFRPRVFASTDGRPALPLAFTENEDDYQYESSDRENHIDFAVRWSHNIGPVDYALSLFKGTERTPRTLICFGRGTGRPGTDEGPNCDLESAVPAPTAQQMLDVAAGLTTEEELRQEFIDAAIPDLRLVPAYDQTERLGLEIQWNLGDILAKAELLHGEQLDTPYQAAVAGFEYIWSNSLGLPLDTRVISEYLYDDRDTTVYQNLFDDDVFFGARFEFQDTQSTTFLIGTIYDLNNYVVLYLAEGTRRLGNASALAIEAQVFSHVDHVPENDPAAFFSTADTYTVKLKLFF